MTIKTTKKQNGCQCIFICTVNQLSDYYKAGPFLTYNLDSPPSPPPPHKIAFCPSPQEKSIFPKFIQTNKGR
jgi:hypothetical protein